MIKRILQNISAANKIGLITLLFYILLLTANYGNKIIVVSFIALFGAYYFISKNSQISLWLTWLASSVVLTGKQYRFELAPPGVYPIEIFPYGIYQLFTITPYLLISIMLAASYLKNSTKKYSILKTNKVDVLIFILFSMAVISDCFLSKNIWTSLSTSLQAFLFMLVYLYTKTLKKNTLLINAGKTVIASLILFEIVLASLQLINGAPLYKNLESQVNLESFGQTADEKGFLFRPVGTFEHANYLGLWLSFMLLMTIAINSKNNTPNSSLYITLIAVFIITTLSRSAWIGTLIGILVYMFIMTKLIKTKPLPHLASKIPTITLLMLPLFFLYLVPRLSNSLNTFYEGGGDLRKEQTKEIIQLIKIAPLTGVGSNQSLIASKDLNTKGIFSKVGLTTHNWYLLAAAEHGIMYPLLWIYIIFIVLKKYLLSLKKPQQHTIMYMKIGWISGTISCMIIALFQPFTGSDLILISSAIIEVMETK